MPRANRITQAGVVHHVIARGNANEDLFRDREDYRKYLSLLSDAIRTNPLYIYNYVLMSNCLHLLVETREEGSLSKAMESVTREYARYFNKKYNRMGHVFLGRFKSFAIEPSTYFFACSRYIDLTPVKAGLAKEAKDYEWSGYSDLAFGKKGDIDVDRHDLYKSLGEKEQERQLVYRGLVHQYLGPELDLENRKSGILGSKEFKLNLKGGGKNEKNN